MAEETPIPIKPLAQGGRLLSVKIMDKGMLYNLYMSFLKNGGLFVPGRNYQFGDEITLKLKLMDESDFLVIKTSVVWVTPMQSQNSHKPGVGLHFVGENWEPVRTKIETYLAGMKSDAQTQTL
ncbi:type IV pilus assembly protein PilZ [Gammaproteobacteria bacterium]